MVAIIIRDEKTAVHCAHEQATAKSIERDTRGFCQAGVTARPMLAIVGGTVAAVEMGGGEYISVIVGQIVGVI